MQIPLDEATRQHLLAKGQDRVQQMCSLRKKRITRALEGQPVKGRVRYELMRLALRLQSQDQATHVPPASSVTNSTYDAPRAS